ncbi:hypothetical protein V8E53_004623 [Lactarius tabidus]
MATLFLHHAAQSSSAWTNRGTELSNLFTAGFHKDPSVLSLAAMPSCLHTLTLPNMPHHATDTAAGDTTMHGRALANHTSGMFRNVSGNTMYGIDGKTLWFQEDPSIEEALLLLFQMIQLQKARSVPESSDCTGLVVAVRRLDKLDVLSGNDTLDSGDGPFEDEATVVRQRVCLSQNVHCLEMWSQYTGLRKDYDGRGSGRAVRAGLWVVKDVVEGDVRERERLNWENIEIGLVSKVPGAPVLEHFALSLDAKS